MSYELLDDLAKDSWTSDAENTDTPKAQAAEELRVEPDRDTMFYFDVVTVLVDNTLFKVPKLPLQQGSDIFREMFSLPPPEGTVADGSDDAHPLRLEQISKDDFRQFLKALFPGPHNKQILPDTIVEWTSVLKLATMWDFEDLRNTVISKMTTMTIECVQKAVLAMDYKVDSWLVPALNDLAKRQQSITLEEMQLLGAELTLKVAAVRESVVTNRNSGCGYCSNGYSCRYCGITGVMVGQREASNIDFTAKIQEVLAKSK